MRTEIVLFFLIGLIVCSCQEKTNRINLVDESEVPGKSASKIIDLTHEFSEESVYWVTAKEFEFDTVFNGRTEKGYFYSAYNFSTAEHGGTHIDAPVHFAINTQSVDQIPLEKLIGNAVKIDISPKSLEQPDYLVSIADLQEWEEQENMQIPKGAIVLLETGYSRYYPDKLKYLGTEKRGEDAVRELHFPGLDSKAAQWLVNSRHINAIGIDTPSIDYGQSEYFKSHVILLSANIPVFENLANLDALPSRGFEIFALPMKIKDGSGAPLRIVAILKE